MAERVAAATGLLGAAAGFSATYASLAAGAGALLLAAPPPPPRPPAPPPQADSSAGLPAGIA